MEGRISEEALTKGTHDTRTASRDAAKQMLQGMKPAGEQTTEVQPTETQPKDTTEVQPEEVTSEELKAEDSEVDAGAEETIEVEESLEIDTTLLDGLSEWGVELGVDPESVPAELKPAYNKLVSAAMQLVEEVVEGNVQNENLRLQQAELSDQIKRDPTKFLLALMVTYPNEFKEVLDVYEAAQQDETVVPRVYRELETEAKLREADRREKLIDYREHIIVARRLTAATRRSAARHGVDAQQAERLVATHIKANQGKLGIEEVDGIVKQLSGSKRQPLRKKVMTPAQAAAAAGAPKETPAGEPAPGVGGETERRGRVKSPIGKLVSDAFKRTMTG